MNTIPQQKLCELITQYGVELCDDPQRCRAFLMDLCPEYKLEVRTLVTALEEPSFSRLRNPTMHIPYEVTRDQLIKDLYKNRGMAQEIAEWTIASWALALGIITSAPSGANPPERVLKPQPGATTAAQRTTTLPSRPPTGARQQQAATAPAGRTSSKSASSRFVLPLVIVVVLISISIFATTSINQSIANTNATATSISIDNDNATATEVGNENTTATAQAYAAETATVVADNPDPYSSSGTLAFIDPLSQADNWQASSDTSFGTQCQYTGGNLQVSQSAANKIGRCFSRNSYTNFTFEVNMTIQQGDCGGITMNSQNSGEHLYWFQLCQDGRYAFYKFTTNTDSTSETSNTTTSAVKTGIGQSNTIAIVDSNGNFDLYVNGQKIDSVTDTSYSQCSIGLVANAESNDTTVTYQNARLWTM